MGHQLRRDPYHRLAGGDQVTFELPSHVPAILDCPQPLLAEPGGPLHQLQMVVCRDANGFRISLSTHLVNSDRGVGALVRVDTDDHYTVNFVLRGVAQYTGDTAALQRTQSGAAQMARDKVSSVRRQGKWLAAIDADTDRHPDLAIERTAEGVDAYGELGNAFSLDPADEPMFARIAAERDRSADV